MGRTAAVPLPSRAVTRGVAPSALEARLALTEILIGCDQGVEAAERTIDWLREHSGAQQVLCLGLDPALKRLIPVTSYGLSPDKIDRFSLEVEDRSHPLVSVLFG